MDMLMQTHLKWLNKWLNFYESLTTGRKNDIFIAQLIFEIKLNHYLA